MNLSEMKTGDIMVCTAAEESINDFSIFGLVVANNPESNSMLIRRYMKRGNLCIGSRTWDYSQIRSYYRSATNEELAEFKANDAIACFS